ncbi:MAG: SDR family oxidoreductase [Devosia sp.]|uniref:SDR family NAD(P)-dependent oxidoreductase n=1 Tax=Devosia sp. TaxID=1871048 RepID=UPI001A5D69E2|nr:SDR family NAD(P)-dependent oxidoreductase [Devosia sp.]MBL8600267.1 SDR family oxidoreductase [Devosia sp.]
MRFERKNVIVTGAAMGLGQVIATSYAKEGADVVIVDRSDASETRAMVEAQGRRCTTFQTDIRDVETTRAAINDAARYFDGRIDILINNAGFNGHYNLVQDTAIDSWRETIDINLTGTMIVTQAVIPFMIAKRSGSIGTTASNVAKRGLRYRADYVCSKWAILGFTQTLALELAEHNIRVNAVCPGPVEGDRIEQIMVRQAAIEKKSVEVLRAEWEDAAPMKRFVSAQEVAAVLQFLTSDASSAMTGQALNVTAGFLMN